MSNLTPAQATVIAAVISAVVTLLICLINSRSQQRRMSEDMAQEMARQEEQRRKSDAVRDAKLEVWMRNVESKLDTHNGYAEKLGQISTDIAVIKNDIKTLYKMS